MRITSVTAQAFGPLDSATLTFTDGLNVIVGRNESAKSSWHAAIYAGLCGRRRGKGASTLEDRLFSARHKPWDRSDAWAVEAHLSLDDGRTIEIHQDLLGKVDCRAIDVTIGRDVSNEIMNAGAPDASTWLGLNRDSFLATACIKQAELLEVLKSSQELQEYLHRAATSSTADVTAAKALELVEEFARDKVGLDKANAVKPLKKAIDAVTAARTVLAEAEQAHAEYRKLVTDVEKTQHEVAVAQQLTVQAETTLAQFEHLAAASVECERQRELLVQAQDRCTRLTATSTQLTQTLQTIEALDAEFAGVAPGDLAQEEGLGSRVSEALGMWASAPHPTELDGDTAETLRLQLSKLPTPPEGDVQPDALVLKATADLRAARERLAHLLQHTPTRETAEDTPNLQAAITATPSVVRNLAAELAAAQSLPDFSDQDLDDLKAAVESARAEAIHARNTAETVSTQSRSVAQRGTRLPMMLWIAAAVLLVVAGVGFSRELVGVAAVAATGAVGAAIGALLSSRRRDASAGTVITQEPATQAARTAATEAERHTIHAEEALRKATSDQGIRRTALEEVAARCAARSLPTNVSELRQLAEEADVWRTKQETLDRSAAELDRARIAVDDQEAHTRHTLSQRDTTLEAPDRPIDELVTAYEAACTARAQQAELARQRETLSARVTQQEAAEAAFQRDYDHHQKAAQAVRDAAVAAGVIAVHEPDDTYTPEALVEVLKQWQQDRLHEMHERDDARSRWERLQTLLEGSTIPEVRARCFEAAQEAQNALTTVTDLEEAVVRGDTAIRAALQAVDIDIDVTVSSTDTTELLLQAKRDLATARDLEREAQAAAHRAEAVQQERGAKLVSVAEATEEMAIAQSELDRVTTLDKTLGLTATFLRDAQERVHRDIAPVISDTLKPWLPRVTDGRYTDMTIDPATLHIQLRAPGKPWRDADKLSVGTAEQVYLLLRVALAKHLATSSETCPLLLDDVMVQADPQRTEALLTLLKEISAERQVIVFAQDPRVEDWAKRHLSGARDQITVLDQVSTV